MSNLATSSPVRVVVAPTAGKRSPTRVLKFSMREVTVLPVEVRAIASFGHAIPMSTLRGNLPRTPFSLQRLLILELCAYQGRAIYTDTSMKVFSDIADLWGTHERLLHNMCVARSVGRIVSPVWKNLERYEVRVPRRLHYTDMNRRYWVATTNSPTDLCRVSLRRALPTSFISRVELQHEVATGHVCPSLIAQIDAAVDNPAELHVAMRHLDCAVVAPYRRLAGHRWRRWAFMRGLVRTPLQPR